MEEKKNEVIHGIVETQEETYKSGSVQYIDSREVADIIGKSHGHLTRDVGRYIKELTQSNIGFTDFFIESSYKDTSGKSNKCYFVTKKGCEFIAHKLTGQKGTEFTAQYINRFHEMESALEDRNNEKLSDYIINNIEKGYQQIALLLQKFMEQQIDLSKRQEELNQMIISRLAKLENDNDTERHPTNPYGINNDGRIESRKKEIYDLTSKVAELCGNSQTRILHYMYRALEENLGIVLDSFKSIYRSETGRQDAGMVEVIAANDCIYEKAVEMNKFVIERKQIYG